MTTNVRLVTGISPSNLTEEVWESVAESYVRSAYLIPDYEEVTSSRWSYVSASDALRTPRGFRLGSVITYHSKLLVNRYHPENMIGFSFDHNAEPYELESAKEQLNVTPESIKEDFQSRIDQLLGGLGIAQTVERR